jgi:hypothetical protein
MEGDSLQEQGKWGGTVVGLSVLGLFSWPLKRSTVFKPKDFLHFLLGMHLLNTEVTLTQAKPSWAVCSFGFPREQCRGSE